MNNWTRDPTWADVEHLAATGELRYGGHIIRDEATYDELMDIHAILAAKGATDREIADAAMLMLGQRERMLH